MTITGLLARRRPEPAPVAAELPPGALDGVLSPRPDPRVFGPEGAPEPGERGPWPEIRCGVHDVGWAGGGPCWLCRVSQSCDNERR